MKPRLVAEVYADLILTGALRRAAEFGLSGLFVGTQRGKAVTILEANDPSPLLTVVYNLWRAGTLPTARERREAVVAAVAAMAPEMKAALKEVL